MSFSRYPLKHPDIVIRDSANKASSKTISFGSSSGGMIHFPAGFPSSTISFEASDGAGGWGLIYDSSGSLVTRLAAAGTCIEIPSQAFGASDIRLISSTDAAAYNVKVTLKI